MTNTRTVSRRGQIRDVVGLLARLTLAAVLLVSGAIKATDARETLVAVRAYQLVPESMVGVVAAVMPYLELALGLLLLVGLATRLAAVLSAVVLVIFIAAVASAAARGLSIDCGCFGSATKNLTFAWHMVIDFALLAALLALWFWPRRSAG